MKFRTFLSTSVIIALLLVGASFHPGTLTKPYDGDSTYYAIAHESSNAYKVYIDYASHRGEGGIPVETLSESQQRAFEEAKQQEPSSSGLRSLGKPPVCSPGLLLCDEYETFPHPVNKGTNDQDYVVIEDSTGDEFIVKIGQADAIADLGPIVMNFTKWVVLGPYALFLGWRKLSTWTSEPTAFSVRYGATLLTVAVAYPYILMFTELSLPSWHLPFLAIVTWGVILDGIWRDRKNILSKLGQITD
ncbi:hypothetical protein [Halopiger xanaduensis]|uniref:Uncharacterized protein n=1 Tax=Halopiger xanaduensis (strain DSM 18323 / JCM 14033 / SH-6) TaxID=797210 RepID=F8D8L1_HALXS|nr:hypothetical protein [Halopiger xanaduensis]AEH36763.1 hypothetical protein Halxa_2138 [Halopiger xanaduensis SH-6]